MTAGAVHHDELLRAGRAVQERALTGDDDGLRAELLRFRDVLVTHTAAERTAVDRLPSATRDVLRRGQDELLAHTDALLERARHRDAECACHVRAVDLTQLVARQARLEGAMLRGR